MISNMMAKNTFGKLYISWGSEDDKIDYFFQIVVAFYLGFKELRTMR